MATKPLLSIDRRGSATATMTYISSKADNMLWDNLTHRCCANAFASFA